MGGYDQAWNEAGIHANERLLQRKRIEADQRQQQQNTVGAQLLNSINNAKAIKPPTDPMTITDEAGKEVPNPTYITKKKNYDDAQDESKKLLSQYASLNSPEQHASFGQHLHGLIFGKPTQQEQQPLLSTNSSPVMPTPDPNAAPVAAPDSTPAAPIHPMAAAPANHPLHAITAGISALGNHLKAFANPLPPEQQPDTALMAKYYRDPGDVANERAKELWGVRGENALAVAQERTKALLAGKPPRPVGDFITIPHLLEQMQQDPDMNVVGPDGHSWTPQQLRELPEGFLSHAYMKGNDVVFGFGDPKSKMWNIGGKDIQVPTYGPVTTDNSTVLGTATGALAKTHEVPGMNPGEKIQLTTKPAETPGMVAAPAAQPATVAPPAPAGEPQNPTLKTRPTPVLPPSPSQKATVDKVNAGRSQSRQIPQPSGMPMPPAFAPGTMLSQGRSAQPVISAMSVVGANIFGGNGEKPIWENAWMYDKPELRQALNNALTLNALKNPGTEENPGFMDSLRTAIGATQWSQEQINQANVQARQELERLGGPEALKQFSREAAMQEDLPALRAATKASAAQGSLALAVRAAPVYNIASAQDFRNQLGTLLSTAVSGMRGYPAINPEYVKWWDRGVAAAKGGPVSSKAPGMHSFAIDDQGRKRPVTDPKAKLPNGWKWAD